MDPRILNLFRHRVFELQECCWENTHLLKWLKLKEVMIPSSDEDEDHLELSYISGENAKLYNHFEKYFV